MISRHWVRLSISLRNMEMVVGGSVCLVKTDNKSGTRALLCEEGTFILADLGELDVICYQVSLVFSCLAYLS